MIATISNVKSAAETAHYLEYGRGASRVENRTERVAWTNGYNLTPEALASPREGLEVAREMHDEASLNDGRAEALFAHLKISWKSAQERGVPDDPTQEEMSEVARIALETLGLTEHQAWVVAHRDTATPHLHILINRVDYETGRVWRGWYSLKKLAGPLRAIEAKKGWATPRGGHELAEKGYVSGGLLSRTPSGSTPLWESKARSEGGRQTFRAKVAAAIGEVTERLNDARGWKDVEDVLSEAKVAGRPLHLEPKRTGFVVTNGESFVRFSAATSTFSKRSWQEEFETSWQEYAQAEASAGRGRAHRLPVEWRRDWSQRLDRALSATAPSRGSSRATSKDTSGSEGTLGAVMALLCSGDSPSLRLEALPKGGYQIGEGLWRIPVGALPNGASLEARVSRRRWARYHSEPSREEVASYFWRVRDEEGLRPFLSTSKDIAPHSRHGEDARKGLSLSILTDEQVVTLLDRNPSFLSESSLHRRNERKVRVLLDAIEVQIRRAHVYYLLRGHEGPDPGTAGRGVASRTREQADWHAREAQLFSAGAQAIRALEQLREDGRYRTAEVKRLLTRYCGELHCSSRAFEEVEADSRRSVSRALARLDHCLVEALKSLPSYRATGRPQLADAARPGRGKDPKEHDAVNGQEAKKKTSLEEKTSVEDSISAGSNEAKTPSPESLEECQRAASTAEAAANALWEGAESMAALRQLASSLPAESAAEAKRLLYRYDCFGCSRERFQKASGRQRKRAQHLREKAARLEELQKALNRRLEEMNESRKRKAKALRILARSAADERDLANSRAAEEHEAICQKFAAAASGEPISELETLHENILERAGLPTGRAALSNNRAVLETKLPPEEVSDRMAGHFRKIWSTREEPQLEEEARSRQELCLAAEQLVWEWGLYAEHRRRLRLERARAQCRRLAALQKGIAIANSQLQRSGAYKQTSPPPDIPSGALAHELRENAAHMRTIGKNINKLRVLWRRAAHPVVETEAGAIFEEYAEKGLRPVGRLFEAAQNLDRDASVLEQFWELAKRAESICDEYWPSRESPPSTLRSTLQFNKLIGSILEGAKAHVENHAEGGRLGAVLSHCHDRLKSRINERTGKNITIERTREWEHHLERRRERERDLGPGL